MLSTLHRGRTGLFAIATVALVALAMLSSARPAGALTGVEVALIITAVAGLVKAACGCRKGGGGEEG